GRPKSRRRDRVAKTRDERRVLRASTRDRELAPADALRRLARERVRDRAGGERDRGRQDVVVRAAALRDAVGQLIGEGLSEVLAPRALGGTSAEVRVGERPAEGILVDATARGAAARGVELLPASSRDEIADDVRGPRVERDDVLGAIGRQQREVRDAPQVQQGDRRAIGEQDVVAERYERR